MSDVTLLSLKEIDRSFIDGLLLDELIYNFNLKVINRIVNNIGITDLTYPNMYFKVHMSRYNETILGLFRNTIKEKHKIEDEYMEDESGNYMFIIRLS
jgi:hypothetical protein